MKSDNPSGPPPPGPPPPPGGGDDPDDAGTSRERTEAIARQRALGRRLRTMYEEVTNEPVPQHFLDLLDELQRKEPPRKEEGK